MVTCAATYRGFVSPNAKLLLEIESDGEAVARQTFFIQGTPDSSAKTIDFSEDEADEDEDDGTVADRH